MKTFNIKDMVKGWFVGDITPVAFSTPSVEVAYKEYKKGDYDKAHYHKIATEVTLISSGSVKMNGVVYSKGEIIIINPMDVTDFEALEDSSTVVVKVPGAKNDKYES
jgi:quercetin dioxygenase-like cupin family protein